MTITEIQNNRLATLIRTCRMILRMTRNRPGASKSEMLYYQMLDKYFSRVFNAKAEGTKVAAHTVFFPVEILYSMGIAPIHNEVCTWTAALLLGDQAEYLAAGAELGLAPEICSPHRGLAGAYARGDLARPDVVLWSNMICDNTAKSGELLMKLNHCPGYFLEHPFGQSELEKKYLVEELQGMISFLEKTTGRKMDWGKYAEAIAEMDKQIKLTREISELRKAVPSPFPARRYEEFLTVDYMFASQPEETEYLTALRDELAEMVRQGQGAVNPERFRLMTLFVPPIYLISFLDKIFMEYGAACVTEPLFTYWHEGELDPSKPLESSAQKSFMIPESRTMYGPLTDATLKDIADCARQYKVDGAIYYAFIGCRHTCATIKLFKDILTEMDIPMCTLDCDIVDPTVTSEAEIREKLERFFELLDDR